MNPVNSSALGFKSRIWWYLRPPNFEGLSEIDYFSSKVTSSAELTRIWGFACPLSIILYVPLAVTIIFLLINLLRSFWIPVAFASQNFSIFPTKVFLALDRSLKKMNQVILEKHPENIKYFSPLAQLMSSPVENTQHLEWWAKKLLAIFY